MSVYIMNPVGILGNMMYLEGRMLQKQYAVDADNCDEHTCQESRMHYMDAEQDGRYICCDMPAKVIRYITFSIVDFVLIINTSL